MRNYGLLAAALSLSLSVSSIRAAILTFDDLSTNGNWIPIAAGYGAYAGFDGLDWGNTSEIPDHTTAANKHLSGYSSLNVAAVSGDYAAINNYGTPYVIVPVAAGQTFTFNGAYLTTINGAYSDPADKENDNYETVIIEGYDASGTLLHQDSITTHSTFPTYFDGQDHFQDISRLVMYGQNPAMWNTNFWMDNFTYNAPVPEPASICMALIGLTVVASRRLARA